MNKPASNTPPARQSSTGYFWLFLVMFVILSVLAASYKPYAEKYSIWNRSWGFDHITLYGTPSKFLFFFLCAILLVPYTNSLVQTGINWLLGKLKIEKHIKLLVFILVSVVSLFVFRYLSVKYYFLGDFNIRMTQTMKKEFLGTEYLTMQIQYWFTSFGMKFGYTTEQLFKLYSYLCGSLFVFFSLLTADLSGKNPFQKVIFFLAQAGTAMVLVFCGYVEVYATPLMLLTVYVYFVLRYLKHGKGFLPAVLVLAFAVACHLLCLAAIPSLAVAWYFNNKNKVPFVKNSTNKRIALYITLLAILALIVAFKVPSNFVLSLTTPTDRPKAMSMFTVRHFWELLNGQLLCCGFSLVFIFVLISKCVREKRPLHAEHYFLLTMTGCFVLLVCIANLQRGSGDWDIMSFPAVTLNLTTMLLIAHLFRTQATIAHYLMLVLTGLNGINAFLWLHVNHTDKSIVKIEKMLVNDPGTYYTARIAGVVQLAIAYNNNKLKREYKQAAYYGCNAVGNDDARPCVMYGFCLKEEKKLDEARDFFENLLVTKSPFVLEAYFYLLEYYERNKDEQKFLLYLNRFYDAFAQRPNAFVLHTQFKPQVTIQLFEFLYQTELPKNNAARLAQMQNVISALKNYKPGAKK